MIPKEQCVDRGVYRIKSRNLTVGVYREAVGGFIGIRLKFNSEFLFEEYHYDNGPPFGTVEPIELLPDVLAAAVEMRETIGTIGEMKCQPAFFDETPMANGRGIKDGKPVGGWRYVGGEFLEKGDTPVAVENKVLFDFLKAIEIRLGVNNGTLYRSRKAQA